MITQTELRRLFEYEPNTGRFRRLVKRHHSHQDYPSSRHSRGYRQITIGGRTYLMHRLVWLYVHGFMPGQIDHINGDRTDNRLCNLREVTQSQNNANSARRKDSTSGVKGVYFSRQKNKWAARIKPSGSKRVHLGFFADRNEAANAYAKAAAEHFGQYARAA